VTALIELGLSAAGDEHVSALLGEALSRSPPDPDVRR